MRSSFRFAACLLCIAIAPALVGAQQVAPQTSKSVLFVCEHGTVKSVLAKVLFEKYAAEVGLDMKAVSRGTRADSIVPPWMQRGLAGDHIDLGSWKPQTIAPSDLMAASYVVSFDVPISATVGARAPHAQWDSLPSVSADYARGRDAINIRVRHLVDSLQRASKTSKP